MKFYIITQKYLENVKRTLKLKTYLHYNLLYNTHLDNVFGKIDFESITNKDIEDFIDSKSYLATSSLKLIICLLKNIIKFANQNLRISNNIIINYKFKSNKKQVEALTKPEQQKIEEYILTNKLYYNYGIIISLYTGLRIGELLALTWQDIDFARKTISITKTANNVTMESKLYSYTSSPKTENSQRVIPLPTAIIPLLKELKKQNGKFVISNKFGEQVFVRVYQTSFSNLLKRLKIKHYGFHSLRHTFATRAVECGVDTKSLSELLGHADVNITLNRYVHSSLELKNRLVNKVGKWLKI